MTLTKQGAFSKKVTDLPNTPSPNITPADIKSYFQTPSDELAATHNALVDDLTADTAAGLLGAKDGAGDTSNVQAELDSLNTNKATTTSLTSATGRISTNETDIANLKANKTDKTGDHLGTWHGFTPSQADPGISSVVDSHTAQLADIAINVKNYGAKGDGVTDDTAAIQAAVNAGAGKTIVFPLPSNNYYVKNTITIPNSLKGTKLVSTAGGRAGDNLIHIDSNFPAGQPVFLLADGTIIENITISNNSGTPVGYGFSFKQNAKWCSLNDVAVIGLDKGIQYGSGCYYNVIRKPIIQQCNTALEIDAVGGNCGGLLVEGGQFSNNKDKGLYMKSGGNDIKLHGVVMEYNTNNHVNSISGTVSLQKCYLADGAITPVYVNGGTVVIDGDDTEYVGGGGAGLALDTTIPTYGIKADSGQVILKNLLLTKNIYANTGIIGGQYYRGFDLYSSNAKVTTRNVRASDYRQVKLDMNINNNLERVNNYVLNGEFHDINHLPFDIKNDGFATVDTTTENGYGGKILKLSGGTGLCQITGKFFAPDLVGKIAYIGIEIADNVGQSAPRFNATNTTAITDGSVPKLSDASYQTGGQFAGWQISGGYSGYPMCHWFPCIVNKAYGNLMYYLYWNANGTAALTVHRIFMVDAEHFQKVATFKSMTVPRYGTAAPTVGTWEVGERVANITPVVGQPKAWVCTVAGTPGTWVSEGNL